MLLENVSVVFTGLTYTQSLLEAVACTNEGDSDGKSALLHKRVRE